MKSGDKSAFPTEMEVHTAFGSTKRAEIGLTKREHYAGLAMQGLLANSYSNGFSQPLSEYDSKSIAKFSIEYADEILKQLEEK